jgi:hypothetical protein
VDQLQAIDRDGLHLAADSYARKRAEHARPQRRAARGWTQRLSALLGK